MSDDPSPRPPTVKEQAEKLLEERLPAGMSDAEAQRYCVAELIPDGADKSEAFVRAAFRTLADGDPRVPQIARQFRQQQLGALRRSPIKGRPH